MNAPEYDKAKAEVWKEAADFYRAEGPYDSEVSVAQMVELFFERNHVVRLPERGPIVVTEERVTPPYPGPIYEAIYIDRKEFSRRLDPFYYQQGIEEGKRQIAATERELRRHLELQTKREAVLTFLTDKQAKETQYEAERQARRDALTQQYLPGTKWDGLLKWARDLIDRLIDAEDRADAVKS